MEKEPVLAIVKNPHKVLRKKSAEIAVSDMIGGEIRDLIRRMKSTLAATSDGVGLAAPQVGKPLALFIVSEEAEEIDRAEKTGWERRRKENPRDPPQKPYEQRAWRYDVFINPVIKNTSRRKREGFEGCLSVPGKFGTVSRHEKITLEAYDEHGKKFTRGASRFFARVIQHELDHLHGMLFIDKTKDLMEIPERKKGDDKK